MDTKRLRPVLFCVYIPAQYIASGSNPSGAIVVGTGDWSSYDVAGYFHGWAQRPVETYDKEGYFEVRTGQIITIGLIEDRDGYVHEVAPGHIKFMDV